MKSLLLIVICLFVFFTRVVSQNSRPPIDRAAIANWADLLGSEPVISNDGKYFMYSIDNLPSGSKTLVIQQTEGDWKKEFIGAEKGFFSSDNTKAIFKSNDSLFVLSLGKNKSLIITDVASFKKPVVAGQWLAYQFKAGNKDLILKNLFTGEIQQYQNVTDYQFENKGRVLLLKKKVKTNISFSETINWINLENKKAYTIWSSTNNLSSASRFAFDSSGKQLLFIVEDKTKELPTNMVWYYQEGVAESTLKVTDQLKGIDSGMIVSNSTPSFSKSGQFILFKIQPRPEVSLKPDPNAVKVDVWNYKDDYLQIRQLQDLGVKDPVKQCYVVLSLKTNLIIWQQEREIISSIVEGPNNYLICKQRSENNDITWDTIKETYCVTSLISGTKIIINDGSDYYSLSPSGKYFVYYNKFKKKYFSYNLFSRNNINLSETVPSNLESEYVDEGVRRNHGSPVGIAGWLENEEILLYDNFDIWRVDPSGKKQAVDITNGFGQRNHIKFRLIKNSFDYPVFANNAEVIISAFNTENKENGFFKVSLDKIRNPELLYIGPYLFYTVTSQTENHTLVSIAPVKAKNSKTWIVQRQRVDEAPNFFITTDFKTFRQLTNVNPETAFNWVTAQLITWKLPNGRQCKGILYKPEDFDSTKKYPLIVNYYQKQSSDLHQFQRPWLMRGNLEISWFTSRNYIVFMPDIDYIIPNPGESVVNSVVSGVNYLLQFSYIDSNRVGIMGHSWGGYQTNYLITHTNIFKAAVEAAGASDFISDYGSVYLKKSHQKIGTAPYEPGGQNRIGNTMWQNLKPYIENSPIFKAHEVTTPLLIMHNKNDDVVLWEQGVELFLALRRLNKKVWMLQYDQGAHGVQATSEFDYTMRVTHFFDHYLKGAQMPDWMINGIPAHRKGSETGFTIEEPVRISNR